ncbi:hypothetical protein LCGC14_2042940 [marine sediment metagenome]|uniref:Uncharacterized protein n=1 Tax=marine sediment metagenome TaxID=412755 RepID=A0A0F9ER64_9ZZZZ
MPRYPTQQAEILALAEAMIGGYTDHAALFPNADAPLLQSLRDAYSSAAAAQTEAMAAAHIATEAKQTALAAMTCGKTAQEAVHIAMQIDPRTGGDVETMELTK